MNDRGGNGASCVGIKVRTDTTKLSDMVIASIGDGRNLIRKGKNFGNRYLIQGWSELDEISQIDREGLAIHHHPDW